MKTLTPKQAWVHLWDNLTADQQDEIKSVPDGTMSASLGVAAMRLSEASEAAHGKGAGPERQLLERLLDENPLS